MAAECARDVTNARIGALVSYFDKKKSGRGGA
jgi:hypothetical protein